MDQLLRNYDNTVGEYERIIADSFSLEDFREYNEILLSANSCAVEGNSFTVDEARELKEKGMSLKLQNHSLFEAFEILDHFKAYGFVFDNLDKPLTEPFVKQTQAILTLNTIKFTKGYDPGEYTRTQMAAGDTVFGDFEVSIERMPQLMRSTEDAIAKGNLHPLEISARFHKFFIYLHPFPDGNGRVGRLISNYILARLGQPHLIIRAADKAGYIDALKLSDKHRDTSILTGYFANLAIERMKTEIAQKKNLTQNFEMSFQPRKRGR
jgi:Fic family protein